MESKVDRFTGSDGNETNGAPPGRLVSSLTSRTRRFAEFAGKWLVRTGGVLIIASILGILLFILVEVWPLMSGAELSDGRIVDLATIPGRQVLVDEHRTHAAILEGDGTVAVVEIDTGREVLRRAIPLEIADISRTVADGLMGTFTGATDDGRVFLIPVRFPVTFDGDRRVVTPVVDEARFLDVDPGGRPLGAFAFRGNEEGGFTAAAQLDSGKLAVLSLSIEEDFLTEEATEVVRRSEARLPGRLTELVVDETGRNLFGGTDHGELMWWPLLDGELGPAVRADAGPSGISALTMLLGGRSLIAGQEDGTLGVWLVIRSGDETKVLTRIREFSGEGASVRLLAPSPRDKGFAAAFANDRIGLYHSTAHRTLWTGDSPVREGTSLFFAPKADALFLLGAGGIAEIDVHNPHPDVSLRALLAKVWYEGYEEPDHVWQSSSATDDFEPKLSLTPLLIGSLKGTFYSLLLAIPLGVLGAMYASQFMHPTLRRYVKPTVEIMAALPSVVLGFLAGLWLAPRLERFFPALLLMLVAAPLAMILSGLLWRSLPRTFRNRVPAGSETLLSMLFLIVALGACLVLSRPAEELLFAGDFRSWLYESTGLRYDQRNAVVVGLAMGFAVIPIIFSIAEDAFSNVPSHLTAGSLALGATRWQTVTRVVLPTASPGIFSAIMIGLGRAVGETMIVLMATGNTPIMDWSPFNGFRTLSANIAVEIPEAPQGGTLYRTLFLAALLLFVLTFVLNTAAELVRQRLRKRYGEI